MADLHDFCTTRCGGCGLGWSSLKPSRRRNAAIALCLVFITVLVLCAWRFGFGRRHLQWRPTDFPRARARLNEHSPLPPSAFATRHSCGGFHTPTADDGSNRDPGTVWYHSISHDLRHWSDDPHSQSRRITHAAIRDVWLNRHHRFWSDFFRVQIIDNRLYGVEREDRDVQWIDHSRTRSLLSELADLLARVKMPDVDLVLNGFDEPAIEIEPTVASATASPPPLLSFCTRAGFADIRMPYTHGMEPAVAAASVAPSASSASGWNQWQSRSGGAVWRGSLTGHPKPTDQTQWRDNIRVRLVCPDPSEPQTPAQTLNAGFTSHFDLTDTEYAADMTDTKRAHLQSVLSELSSRCGGVVAPIPMTTQAMTYKYVIDVDGNAWSSRFINWLPLGVVVLKQKSPYLDFLSPPEVLTPGVHFLSWDAPPPPPPDAQPDRSVRQTIRNVLASRGSAGSAEDRLSFEISARAQNFALKNLNPDGMRLQLSR